MKNKRNKIHRFCGVLIHTQYGYNFEDKKYRLKKGAK